MTKEAEEAFRTIFTKRVKLKVEPMINGYSGFLYLDKNNMPGWHFIGKNTFSIFLPSIISFISFRCPKLLLMYADIPSAPRRRKAE